MSLLLAPALAATPRRNKATPAAGAEQPAGRHLHAGRLRSAPRRRARPPRHARSTAISASRRRRVRVEPGGPGRDPGPRRRLRPKRRRTRLGATSATPGHRDHAQRLQSRRLGRLAALRPLRRRRPGRRRHRSPAAANSAQVGMSYRATRRFTGRVAVAAERAEGAQRLLAEDQAYSLDVGGAYSIARNVDVTAGVRYRIARDRSSRCARRAPRQPGRLRRHRLPLLILRPGVDLRPSHMRRARRCLRARRRSCRPARSPAAGCARQPRRIGRPERRALGMAAGRKDRRQEEQSAPAARRRGSRPDRGPARCRAPAPAPAVAAVGAPGARDARPARRAAAGRGARAIAAPAEQRAARSRAGCNGERRSRRRAAAARPRPAGRRPGARRSSARGAAEAGGRHGASYSSRHGGVITWQRSRPASARRPARPAARRRRHPDRRLQDPAAEAIEPLIRPASAISARIGCRRRRPNGRRCSARHPDVRLHLIGQLQSNKAEDAVALFDAIHSVDRPSLSRRSPRRWRRPAGGPIASSRSISATSRRRAAARSPICPPCSTRRGRACRSPA